MFKHVFKDPYVDILKLFAADDWRNAELKGNVKQAVDKAIGKKVVALKGVISGANSLDLPKAGSLPLGLNGRYLYLQVFLEPGKIWKMDIDIMLSRGIPPASGFVTRVSLSSRYTETKRVGTVLQLAAPALKHTAGTWTVLAVDLPALLLEHLGDGTAAYTCLKGLSFYAAMSVRAAFISDTAYTPDTLPRDFLFPLFAGCAWAELYAWYALPQTTSAATAALTAMTAAPKEAPKISSPIKRRPLATLAAGAAPGLRRRVMGPAELLHGRAAAPAAAEMAPALSSSSTSSASQARAPRLLPAPPCSQPPPPLRAGEKPGVLGGSPKQHDRLRRLVPGGGAGAGERGAEAPDRHTAPVVALSAAQTNKFVASAQEGRWPSSASGTASPPSPSPSSTTTTRTCSRRDAPPHPPPPSTLAAPARRSPSPPRASQVRLSADGSLLAALGKDVRGRQLLGVWDVRGASGPTPSSR